MDSRKRITEWKLHRIFLLSALFCSFFSFFGVYSYKLYSARWFILFYIYELLFYFGLRSGRFVFKQTDTVAKNTKYDFYLTKTGAILLWICCIISILSFGYFVYLYHNVLGAFSFGSYTADLFAEGRTTLDKMGLLMMQIGGESTFMILATDCSPYHRKLKVLSCITLFLPGLRFLFMGSRFAIAVEFLILFFAKWPGIQKEIDVDAMSSIARRVVIIGGIMMIAAFAIIFATRAAAASYTALERKAFVPGDLLMKQFWRNMYMTSSGTVEIIAALSDYLGESPYTFAYICEFYLPNRVFHGQLILRSITKIVHYLTGLWSDIDTWYQYMKTGQYSGFAYMLIADFGLVGSIFAAFVFGRIFAIVEKNSFRITSCAVIYPAIKAICFFAPIYYFFVGRVDYAILFSLILVPLCLRKRKAAYEE